MRPFTSYETQWIYYETGAVKNEEARYGGPSPYFRKEFTAAGKIKRAELAATALGVFRAYLNGEPAGEDYLSPGWTDYDTRVPLIRYDVTSLMRGAGKNAVVLVAGDGWFVGHIGNRMLRNNYGTRIEVAAELTIEYEDGGRQTIGTDRSWKAGEGEIRRSDLYMGEYIDHNHTKKGVFLPGYDDSDWDHARHGCWHRYGLLTERVAPLTVVKHVLEPVDVKRVNGKTVYDFGQNLVGVLRVRAAGEAGSCVVARHGEMTYPDGSLYTDNLRTAEATDTFCLSGDGVEEFRPLFTFHGFRYAELHVPIGRAEILGICAEVMYSDLAETGSFTCSDAMVNRLYSNIVWGQRGNFLNVPTDCPQRDERLGWTGDAQIFCGTAMYNMDCRAFYRKYLYDLCDAQTGAGAVPGIVPVLKLRQDNRLETSRFSAGWQDVMAVLPYEYYLMYGDRETVREFLPNVKKYIGWLEYTDDGRLQRGEWDFGDWLNVGEETDKDLLASAYYAYSVSRAAALCRAVGDADGERFDDLYGEIRAAFRKRFLTASGLTCGSQTAYALSYSFGLIAAKEAREGLVAAVRRADGHLSTGFLGVKFLLPALCELGETDTAYRILTNRTYPGWGYSVENGATTVWERWNSYTRENGFGDVRMNSFNHYSLGSCGEWMFRYCLGIAPSFSGAGFAALTLRPYIDTSGRMTHASGSYESVRGRIEAGWKVTDGKVFYTAKVPKEVALSVDVPQGVETEIARY